MVIIVNKKSLVVQSNSLVEAKYRLSVEEQKIVRILISQIKREDKDFQSYEFRIKELAEILGMEHKDPYRVLEKITERLISRVLKFYNPKTETLLQAAWLSSAEYKKGLGTVELCFDPKLKPLLLQLKAYFTQYELGQVLQFKGQYTIRFFEFRKSFLGRNKKIVEFPLDELREIFGLQKDEYRDFDNFRRRVLEPARLELLEKTGQSFSWEVMRQGKGGKVVGVRVFFEEGIEKNESTTMVPSPPSLDQNPVPLLSPIVPTTKEAPMGESKNLKVMEWLIDFGIAPPVAETLIQTYAEPYIQEKIAILNAHDGPVKSKAGFLVKALQENWKDAQEEERRKNEERRQEEKAEKSRKRRFRLIREAFDQYQKNHTFQQYEAAPETSRAAWRNEFLATLAPIFEKRYASRPDFGIEDAYFRAFVMQNKLVPLTLDDYLAQEGMSLEPEDRRALDAL